jgi:hypothetical protein
LNLAGNWASSQTGDTQQGLNFIPVGRKYHAPVDSHLQFYAPSLAPQMDTASEAKMHIARRRLQLFVLLQN